MDEQFIWITSNSTHYPDNKPNDFRVRLAHPLRFPKGDYVCALSNIVYSHSWVDLEEEWMYIEFQKYSNIPNIRIPFPRVQLFNHATLIHYLNEILAVNIETLSKWTGIKKRKRGDVWEIYDEDVEKRKQEMEKEHPGEELPTEDYRPHPKNIKPTPKRKRSSTIGQTKRPKRQEDDDDNVIRENEQEVVVTTDEEDDNVIREHEQEVVDDNEDEDAKQEDDKKPPEPPKIVEHKPKLPDVVVIEHPSMLYLGDPVLKVLDKAIEKPESPETPTVSEDEMEVVYPEEYNIPGEQNPLQEDWMADPHILHQPHKRAIIYDELISMHEPHPYTKLLNIGPWEPNETVTLGLPQFWEKTGARIQPLYQRRVPRTVLKLICNALMNSKIEAKLTKLGRLQYVFDHIRVHRIYLSPSLGHVTGFGKQAIYPYQIARYSPDLKAGVNQFIVYETNGLIGNSLFGDKNTRVLRHVPIRGKPGDVIDENYPNPILVPVVAQDINELHFELRTMDGKLMPFQYGTVTMVLYFKRKIF